MPDKCPLSEDRVAFIAHETLCRLGLGGEPTASRLEAASAGIRLAATEAADAAYDDCERLSCTYCAYMIRSRRERGRS